MWMFVFCRGRRRWLCRPLARKKAQRMLRAVTLVEEHLDDPLDRDVKNSYSISTN